MTRHSVRSDVREERIQSDPLSVFPSDKCHALVRAVKLNHNKPLSNPNLLPRFRTASTRTWADLPQQICCVRAHKPGGEHHWPCPVQLFEGSTPNVPASTRLDRPSPSTAHRYTTDPDVCCHATHPTSMPAVTLPTRPSCSPSRYPPDLNARRYATHPTPMLAVTPPVRLPFVYHS